MQNITVNERQHLLDVAIQDAGSAEAATLLALQNEIGITEALSTADSLANVTPINKEVVQALATENHKPATDGVIVPEGIGFFRIGIDFIIE